MATVKAANLALKFLLELGAFAAFAYWGASVGTGVASLLMGIAAPVAAIVLWGLFAAPRSTRRLPLRLRVLFELSVFGLAAAALTTLGAVALVFAVAVVVNAILLTVFDQWAS